MFGYFKGIPVRLVSRHRITISVVKHHFLRLWLMRHATPQATALRYTRLLRGLSIKPHMNKPVVQLYLELDYEEARRPIRYNRSRPQELLDNFKRICFEKTVNSRRRIQERTRYIKEELIASVWHPRRVEKWLEAGVALELL